MGRGRESREGRGGKAMGGESEKKPTHREAEAATGRQEREQHTMVHLGEENKKNMKTNNAAIRKTKIKSIKERATVTGKYSIRSGGATARTEILRSRSCASCASVALIHHRPHYDE